MKETYQQYLQSPHWQKTRSQKRARAKTCGVCGEAARLDVHHLNYRDLLDVEMSDLRVLCRECHFLAHALHRRGAFRFSSTNHLHRWEVLKAAVKAHFREGHAKPEWSGAVTLRWLLWHATERGGWTKAQMDVLGVRWPPVKGWLRQSVGKRLTNEQRLAFER